LGTAVFPAPGVPEAGHEKCRNETKNAATDSGYACKDTAKKAGSAVKKGTNKAAGKTEEGADKVKQKTDAKPDSNAK
jgi:hypothetical protein